MWYDVIVRQGTVEYEIQWCISVTMCNCDPGSRGRSRAMIIG